MHTDEDTGRVYYYNTVTKEVTWDFPGVENKKPKVSSSSTARANYPKPYKVYRY